MSKITDLCNEIAEKIPQVYEAGKKAGGGTKPSFAQIAKRTSLRHWYQYLIDNYTYEFDEEYNEFLNAELMESIEYPLYTQDITDFSNFANGSIYHPMAMQLYDIGVRVKKFSGTLDTSNGTNFSRMFWLCADTEDVGELSDTSNGTNFNDMFEGCSALTSVPSLDTSNGTNFAMMFYNCKALTSIPPLDLRKATIASSMLNYCSTLLTVGLKNIKINLQIGSGSSWGHLLTVDSLVNTIYECRDTGSTKTLTVGSANLAKLANVYVKLIDITDEMRAEDDLIDEKKPFEVCESTDEGAMLITNYVGLKNWKLA